jgi:hypothetical protein
MEKSLRKKLIIGLIAGVSAPLIVEAIKKAYKKYEASKEPKIPANTDHGFNSWVGDDNFFEIEGDNNVTTNPHLHLADLTSRERMKNYPTFKKYSKFDVSPAKKIKLK